MPTELESEWRVELPERNWKHILSFAENLGPVIFDGRVTDLVFSARGDDLISNGDWIVRIRQSEHLSLQLKLRISESVWEETSVRIDDPGSMRHILTKMGLQPHLLLDRWRKTIIRDGWTMAFDAFEELGWFVEVEEPVGATGDGPFARVIEELGSYCRMPPYGQIVRERRRRDPMFDNWIASRLASFNF